MDLDLRVLGFVTRYLADRRAGERTVLGNSGTGMEEIREF